MSTVSVVDVGTQVSEVLKAENPKNYWLNETFCDLSSFINDLKLPRASNSIAIVHAHKQDNVREAACIWALVISISDSGKIPSLQLQDSQMNFTKLSPNRPVVSHCDGFMETQT